MKIKTVYIKTQGCQMNEYDSNRMFDILKMTHGLKPTEFPEEADLLLLNTCSIREKAQEKVFSELGRWRKLKEKKPHVVIGVGGCVASQEGKDLLKRAPYVDIVFGPQTLHRLPNMLSTVTKHPAPLVDISFPKIEKFDVLPTPEANGPLAYVSIMEGCSKYCSYCVVPYTRGEEISRPFDDIIHEVVMLTKQGVREITLLGQNVNAYRGYKFQSSLGIENDDQNNGDNLADLALLLRYLSEIDEVSRIRFTTSHPVEFSERLIEAYALIPKLANHLHLPVQSGSDRILGLMKRGYKREEYKQKIALLRHHRPDISITSDFIVGFPGETDEDFMDTLNLIAEVNFDQSFSFIYSQRPGTPAANLKDDIPTSVKQQRLQLLQSRLTQNAVQYSQSMLGTIQRVLITGPAKGNPNLLSGKTDNNRVVNIVDKKGQEGLVKSLHSDIGKIIQASIIDVNMHTLTGEIT